MLNCRGSVGPSPMIPTRQNPKCASKEVLQRGISLACMPCLCTYFLPSEVARERTGPLPPWTPLSDVQDTSHALMTDRFLAQVSPRPAAGSDSPRGLLLLLPPQRSVSQ